MSKYSGSSASVTIPRIVLAGLVAVSLQACNPTIDARQSHTEQGLIYKKGASDPFTGKLTNVDIIQVGKRHAAQYGAWEGGCTVPVHDGLYDGVAECMDTKGKKVGEFTYSKGNIDGAVKLWASDTGNLMMSTVIRGGVTDGTEERYNPKSGKMIGSINYQAGQKVGSEKRWDITGDILLTDLTWEDGKQTGVSRFGEREEHYKAGVYDGVWKACELNRSLPLERLKPNYEKARVYNALAEKLGGTYFVAALVDDPSGVVCTETVYKDGVKQAAAVANPPPGTEDACLDAKIAAFRKENGDEAPIVHGVMQEWEAGCKQ